MTPQDAKEFNHRLSNLMNAYDVVWKFQLVPKNLFTKLIKKFIKVSIVLGVQDKQSNETR